jgi:hypothetical protein
MKREKMQAMIRNISHEIIAIIYIDGKVHDVTTVIPVYYSTHGPYFRIYHWDFDENKHWDDGEMMFFNSGSGGELKDIAAPKFIKGGTKAEYWLSPGIKFR